MMSAAQTFSQMLYGDLPLFSTVTTKSLAWYKRVKWDKNESWCVFCGTELTPSDSAEFSLMSGLQKKKKKCTEQIQQPAEFKNAAANKP